MSVVATTVLHNNLDMFSYTSQKRKSHKVRARNLRTLILQNVGQILQMPIPQSSDAGPAKCRPAICGNAQLILRNKHTHKSQYYKGIEKKRKENK